MANMKSYLLCIVVGTFLAAQYATAIMASTMVPTEDTANMTANMTMEAAVMTTETELTTQAPTTTTTAATTTTTKSDDELDPALIIIPVILLGVPIIILIYVIVKCLCCKEKKAEEEAENDGIQLHEIFDGAGPSKRSHHGRDNGGVDVEEM